MNARHIGGIGAFAAFVVFTFTLFSPATSANGHGPFSGRTRVVNCGAPGFSIQRAIDRVLLAGPLTVVVRGECVENPEVTRDDVTLVAHSQGGSIFGTLNVVGAQRIVIDGLIVTGDGDGLSVRDNASATIRNATLEGNSGSGVFASRNALVILHDNLIRENGAYGVFVADGANAQIRGGNTIESDVADWLNVGATIGAYRHATIRIRDGGNVIRNNAMQPVVSPGPLPGPLPPPVPPPAPPQSADAVGFAIDLEHNSSFRQDNGRAVIEGHVEIFNLTSADFRDMDFTGHIFIDGLNANVRMRNSFVKGGMTMFGIANFRHTVQWQGDIYCNRNYLNPAVVPSPGQRIECAPEIFVPPQGPPPP